LCYKIIFDSSLFDSKTWNETQVIRSLKDNAYKQLGTSGTGTMAYKDIHAVMAAQHDLVEVLAKFEPRIVRMANAKEKPED
jgi:tRNA-splicing ligase RtcB